MDGVRGETEAALALTRGRIFYQGDWRRRTYHGAGGGARGRRSLLGSAVQSFRRLAVSQVAVNKRRELGFRKCSDLLRGNLTALEQDQRRDAADAVLHRRARIGVDVELGDS